MTRISALNQRYAASAVLARRGVQITAVGDPAGARYNAAVRRLVTALRDAGPGLWDDLVGASKALRWRLITQPQPIAFNQGLVDLAGEVRRHAKRLRGALAEQALLDELGASAAGLVEADPAVGEVLLRDCREAGVRDCVVVVASRPAQAGLAPWLREHGVPVFSSGELESAPPERNQAYVVGPPRFYRSSLVTAPVTSEVRFLLPAWFGDRSVPRSAIAPYANGGIRVQARVFTEGDVSEPEFGVEEVADEESYLPLPVWGNRKAAVREPTNEEVIARKVLLSGNLAMWLDDGERIRSLDPHQPAGERVAYTEVTAVRDGTYLLLRQGATERGALYQAALAKLGHQAEAVDAAQTAWKKSLARCLEQYGYRNVTKYLRSAGIKAADRARAWTDASLIRPHSDQDFEALLQWLDIPIQPTFGYASLLRRMHYQASAEIGRQLEAAVAAADLKELETAGHLRLDIRTGGFRGILATRVLAVSPYFEIVLRRDARVPFIDWSGKWLE